MKRQPTMRQLRARARNSDLGNVVILPTAAPRQVRQGLTQSWCDARRETIKAQGRAFPYKHHQVREAERSAQIMLTHGKSPELLLILAILQELDLGARQRIVDRLAKSTGTDCGAAAFEFARMTVMNFGQRHDLERALQKLTE